MRVVEIPRVIFFIMFCEDRGVLGMIQSACLVQLGQFSYSARPPSAHTHE